MALIEYGGQFVWGRDNRLLEGMDIVGDWKLKLGSDFVVGIVVVLKFE